MIVLFCILIIFVFLGAFEFLGLCVRLISKPKKISFYYIWKHGKKCFALMFSAFLIYFFFGAQIEDELNYWEGEISGKIDTLLKDSPVKINIDIQTEEEGIEEIKKGETQSE
jgi:Trk-type K+ transport system membrane component